MVCTSSPGSRIPCSRCARHACEAAPVIRGGPGLAPEVCLDPPAPFFVLVVSRRVSRHDPLVSRPWPRWSPRFCPGGVLAVAPWPRRCPGLYFHASQFVAAHRSGSERASRLLARAWWCLGRCAVIIVSTIVLDTQRSPIPQAHHPKGGRIGSFGRGLPEFLLPILGDVGE